MNNFWLKLRIWTKTVLYVALFLYVLLFFFNNTTDMKVWYWFGEKHSYQGATWWVMLFVFLAGAVAAFLIRTIFKTLRQIRELKARNQTSRMERELAEMKSKAAMLQTKPAAPPGTMVIDSAPPKTLDEAADERR